MDKLHTCDSQRVRPRYMVWILRNIRWKIDTRRESSKVSFSLWISKISVRWCFVRSELDNELWWNKKFDEWNCVHIFVGMKKISIDRKISLDATFSLRSKTKNILCPHKPFKWTCKLFCVTKQYKTYLYFYFFLNWNSWMYFYLRCF